MMKACPSCRSKDIIKDGMRYNKYSLVQKYLCRYCQFRFVELNDRLTKHQKIIKQLAIDLWKRGLSLRSTAKHIEKFYSVKVSNVSILRWLDKQ